MPNSAAAPRLEAAPKSFGSAHDGRMNDVVHGHCDNRFDKVAEALADEIAKGEELGASIALDIDGELVVDIWGGHADRAKSMPWATEHDRQLLLLHEDADRPRRIDRDRPWPGRCFCAGGQVLARIRREWQAGHRGAPPAIPHVGRFRVGATVRHRGHLRLGESDQSSRASATVVAAGNRVRVITWSTTVT